MTHQVKLVSLDPVLPAAVRLLSLLGADQLVPFPVHQTLEDERETSRSGDIKLTVGIRILAAQ